MSNKRPSENRSVGPRSCEDKPFDPAQGPERQSTTLSEVERSNGPDKETEAGYAEGRVHSRCRATQPGAAAADRSQEWFADGR